MQRREQGRAETEEAEGAAAKARLPGGFCDRGRETRVVVDHQIWEPLPLMRCPGGAWRERLMAPQPPEEQRNFTDPESQSDAVERFLSARATTASWRWNKRSTGDRGGRAQQPAPPMLKPPSNPCWSSLAASAGALSDVTDDLECGLLERGQRHAGLNRALTPT